MEKQYRNTCTRIWFICGIHFCVLVQNYLSLEGAPVLKFSGKSTALYDIPVVHFSNTMNMLMYDHKVFLGLLELVFITTSFLFSNAIKAGLYITP